MTYYSGNGWVAAEDPEDIGITPLVVNGVNFAPGIRGGDVATVLGYVAQQVNDQVEPLTIGGGYSFRANVNDPTSLSNHSSGTAIDYNYPSHPNAEPTTASWTDVQIAQIHVILAEVDGVVRWGGDYHSTPDSMHFEINAGPVAVARVAVTLAGGQPPDQGGGDVAIAPVWSDGLYLDGVPPNQSNRTTVPYGSTLSYKMLPLTGDRCLIGYEWEQNNYADSPDGTLSYRARVVAAGDPPTGGEVCVVVDFDAIEEAHFGPKSSGSQYVNYGFGLSAISETRAVLTATGGRSRYDSTANVVRRNSIVMVVLLAIGDTEVSVLDTWTAAQDSDDTDRVYDEYVTSVSLAGGSVAAFIPSYNRTGTRTYNTDRLHISATDDVLSVASMPTPISLPGSGAWANPTGTIGCVIGYGLNDTHQVIWPFTSDGVTLTFSPAVTFTGWTHYEAINSQNANWRWMNEGTLAQGPEANQFIVSVNDQPDFSDNEYLNIAVLETDGTAVTLVGESMPYYDDGGFGYPDAWLPSTSTPNGQTATLYSTGRASLDTNPSGGGHGHQHGGDPVLLLDLVGQTSYDDVVEAQMPRTGLWSIFQVDSGFWIRNLQATESGVFVAVAASLAVFSDFETYPPTAAAIGWIPLGVAEPATLTAEFTFALDASGRMVTFDASPSGPDAGENPIVSYAWDFGEHYTVQPPAQQTDARIVEHTFYSLGPFQVTLTVTDSSDATASVTHEVDLAATAIDGDYDNDRCSFSGAS